MSRTPCFPWPVWPSSSLLSIAPTGVFLTALSLGRPASSFQIYDYTHGPIQMVQDNAIMTH